MNIPFARLQSQQLLSPQFTDVQSIAKWMGAIQAQDFNMSKWAIQSRLPNIDHTQIENAFNDGEILRTHLLRPTWHLVSKDNISWLIKLSAPQIKSLMKLHENKLGIDHQTYHQCNDILIRLLTNNQHKTREEIATAFNNAKISTDNNRLSLLLMNAEIEGIICSGQPNSKKHTYALLSDRAPIYAYFNKEEALYQLANCYFSSRGPATLQDFKWWSGLNATDSKRALSLVSSTFSSFNMLNETYFFNEEYCRYENFSEPQIHLLAGFDEFLIAYTNRNASLQTSHKSKVITANGLFKPTVVVDGQVVGVWGNTNPKEIAISYIEPVSVVIKKLIEQQIHTKYQLNLSQ